MFPATYWLIFALLASLMAVLAWVGWKFFYPSTCEAPTKTTTPTRAKRKLPRMSLPSLGGVPGFLKSKKALWLPVPILLMGLTVALTLTFSKHFELDPLTAQRLAPEGQVSMRLNQEKLVPPPPLPPSLFISTDRPNLESADRDWSHLDPDFVQIVLKLFAKMTQRGYPIALLEGYRSPERQDMLADKGTSVTNARANQSKHQFRVAVDLAPIKDGQLLISERNPWAAAAYKVLGEESQALGLIWGGGWAMRDLGHVESSRKIQGGHLSR